MVHRVVGSVRISSPVRVESGEERRIALGEALLHTHPVLVALVRLADGAAVEGPMAAQPRHQAAGLASFAKGCDGEVEFGHGAVSLGGRRRGLHPTSAGWYWYS